MESWMAVRSSGRGSWTVERRALRVRGDWAGRRVVWW